MTVTILTGCYSLKHYTPKTVTIETTPEASVFWHGGTFDGRYIQTANNEGVVKTGTSEHLYREGRGTGPDSLLSWNCRRSATSGYQCVPLGVLAKVLRNEE